MVKIWPTFVLLWSLCLTTQVRAADDDGSAEGANKVVANDSPEVVKAPAPAPTESGTKVDTWWQMIARNKECSSDDVELGEADSIEECAIRCEVFENCQYFIYGHGEKQNLCWYESTQDGCTQDGSLIDNDYNLYEIKGEDVNDGVFQTLDTDYQFYRLVVTDTRILAFNASYCIEDIIFYDGDGAVIDTNGGACSLNQINDMSGPCCLSSGSLDNHDCNEAFNAELSDSWYCSSSALGFIGYQFDKQVYIHSYAVHDVYGVHALDPKTWTLQASNDGFSWLVIDVAENVAWISEAGIYFNIVGGVSYSMIYREAECSSPDIMLGMVSSAEKCAEACANIDGCQYFIFGKNEKAGRCYYEITEDGCASDGYPQKDDYDLYYIHRSGAVGDGGATVGNVAVSTSNLSCGSFFGSCSNVFLLLFLVLALVGGVYLLRSILKKRYARVTQNLEYDAGVRPDESEA